MESIYNRSILSLKLSRLLWLVACALTSQSTDKCSDDVGRFLRICEASDLSVVGTKRNLGFLSLCLCNFDSYLVDPASGHMLVSKIKPCMSKHELN